MSEEEEQILGYRPDGSPIYVRDYDKKKAEIQDEKEKKGLLSRFFPKKEKDKEETPMNETKPELEEGEPKQLPELVEETQETAIEPARPLYDLVRKKGLELDLIREFELRPQVDYYVIGQKQIFTKEGLSKFMPFILINGFKVSYKVVDVCDEPLYKRVRVRAWLGPEAAPIQVAEGSCDWREELAWAETILDKVGKTLKKLERNTPLDEKRDLRPEDIAYDSETGQTQIVDEVKRYYCTIDHLRKRIFALRVTEGKAIRRAFSHLTGLSSTTKTELETIEAEARVLHEKEE